MAPGRARAGSRWCLAAEPKRSVEAERPDVACIRPVGAIAVASYHRRQMILPQSEPTGWMPWPLARQPEDGGVSASSTEYSGQRSDVDVSKYLQPRLLMARHLLLRRDVMLVQQVALMGLTR